MSRRPGPDEPASGGGRLVVMTHYRLRRRRLVEPMDYVRVLNILHSIVLFSRGPLGWLTN